MRYLLLLLLATRASAQHLDTLYVGHAPLSTAYMRNDSSESLVMVPDSNGSRVIGKTTSRQRVVDGKLFRVAHFSSAHANVTDSIMTGGAGVLPMWEISHQTSKVMHLRWDGHRVTGDVTPTGKPKETVDQRMAVAAFNSSERRPVDPVASARARLHGTGGDVRVRDPWRIAPRHTRRHRT